MPRWTLTTQPETHVLAAAAAFALLGSAVAPVGAQQPPTAPATTPSAAAAPLPYGAPISMEAARRAMVAAEARLRCLRNRSWTITATMIRTGAPPRR